MVPQHSQPWITTYLPTLPPGGIISRPYTKSAYFGSGRSSLERCLARVTVCLAPADSSYTEGGTDRVEFAFWTASTAPLNTSSTSRHPKNFPPDLDICGRLCRGEATRASPPPSIVFPSMSVTMTSSSECFQFCSGIEMNTIRLAIPFV